MIGYETGTKLEGKLGEFKNALQDEIIAVKKTGQSSVNLLNGQLKSNYGTEYIYHFYLETTKTILPDTPCKLIVGLKSYDVIIVSVDDDEINLVCKTKLPDNLLKAKLENDATILMELLIKRLEANSSKSNYLGEKILSEKNNINFNKILKKSLIEINPERNLAQKNAIISALENDITYIWGPPGTGKTAVIADIIANLYANNRSTLIISHTNTAVDGAIEKVTKHPKIKDAVTNRDYPILRYGISTKNLDERVYIQSHIQWIGRELLVQKNILENDKEGLQKKLEIVENKVNKLEWKNSSNLLELEEKFIIYQNNKKELEKLRKEENNKKEILKTIKIDENERRKLENFKIKLKEVKDKYEEKNKIKDQILFEKRRIEKRIESVEDEINKHEQYENLKEEKRKYYSLEKIKEIINETEKELKCLIENKKELEEKSKKLNGIILEYERKNQLEKLFVSKEKIKNTQLQLTKLRGNIDSNEKNINSKNQILKIYTKQLKEVENINIRLNGFHLSETKNFWNTRKLELKQELILLQNKDIENEKEIKNVKLLYESLKENQKKEYLKYDKNINERLILEEKIHSLEKKLLNIKKFLTEKIDIEKVYCLKLNYKVNESNLINQYEEIKEKYKEITIECERYVIENILKEKELLNTNINTIGQEIETINSKIRELENQILLKTPIIGTTLTKTYINDILQERKFDTVILDEASMASIPALWCASYLADKNIVIVGDFLQLSPIVMAKTEIAKKWLGTDIFTINKVRDIFRKTYRKY